MSACAGFIKACVIFLTVYCYSEVIALFIVQFGTEISAIVTFSKTSSCIRHSVFQ